MRSKMIKWGVGFACFYSLLVWLVFGAPPRKGGGEPWVSMVLAVVLIVLSIVLLVRDNKREKQK